MSKNQSNANSSSSSTSLSQSATMITGGTLIPGTNAGSSIISSSALLANNGTNNTSNSNGKLLRKVSKSDLNATIPTPAQIIREAKEKLNNSISSKHQQQQPITQTDSNMTGMRTLSAQRPFTPREEKRALFGPKSNRLVNERPPSSF